MGPGNKPNILQLIAGAEPLGAMRRAYDSAGRTVLLRDMVGGALSVYAAALIARTGGTHVFVAEDRDAAAYLLNDFYALLDEKQVYFFPGSYKRSIVYGTEDAQGVVQRTAALSALRREMAAGEYRIICTYPEALAERVTDPDSMRRETVRVKVGDRLAIGELEELLADSGFTKVDFVYEPGQYSLRGGIFDVFSFSESKPYRLDFFGEEVDSIRRFEISSQLSADRLNEVEIVPNLNGFAGDRISLPAFAGEVIYWFFDPDYVLRRVNDLRRKVLGEMEEPAEIDTHLVSRKVLLQDMAGMRLFELRDSLKERPADATVAFRTAPQPKFNKNFELLADDIISNGQRGYKTYILSENRAQLERLENIFYQSGRKEAQINPLPITLHEGFIDHDLKLCFYTDHQIFDRYQRYRINGEIKRDEQMTVAELNQLRMGDYVVHIDHGVGRFGGLVKINENGKVHEAIKLIYKDNDVLFVHVHALHRISRYKSGEGEAPKIYKLGSGAWQKLKTATKKAVKDISRELIALYAKRKASKGFAFSPDTYLQQELEASFMWEDTPDQQTATQAVKRDMESDQPMDRLICGDVGFGKTEVALRAAFRAASEGRQVALLCPTTVLAEQHYQTFRARLAGFPVTVGLLSRFVPRARQKEVLKAAAEGQIDILLGTHRLLSSDVSLPNLSLLILDEEQRFGVRHKEKLKALKKNVDVLTLTATPLPRTLQLSMSGIRDLSVIETAPQDRKPVATAVLRRDDATLRTVLERELAREGQVFWVYNRVQGLERVAEYVRKLVPAARVGMAHGQMSESELESNMHKFWHGELDVLVCTAIVESGLDFPRANTLVVDQAQLFGLGQLYQLRGRVGRSDRQAYAFFVVPDTEHLSEVAGERLRIIMDMDYLGAGFQVAMEDLRLRGAGNILGEVQSGHMGRVGLDLYLEMLEEAVARLKGTPVTQDVETELNLGLPAHIPQSYIEDGRERLRCYKALTSATSGAAREEVALSMRDRFGSFPQELANFIAVLDFKQFLSRLQVRRADIYLDHVRLVWGDGQTAVQPERI
uniref:transcription-repair coupling factor n=1 Tax=Alistipes putredinis TaxID=28117 RepID=UPI003AB4CBA8